MDSEGDSPFLNGKTDEFSLTHYRKPNMPMSQNAVVTMAALNGSPEDVRRAAISPRPKGRGKYCENAIKTLAADLHE